VLEYRKARSKGRKYRRGEEGGWRGRAREDKLREIHREEIGRIVKGNGVENSRSGYVLNSERVKVSGV
jgi:hypothetical protein